ncbi:MAG: hypothetical protein COS88_03915 [Chloroflexi bacterium CG07_land_8_20_14_0_80_51_10]|nr:MAG: hypothetical protein COS88_03915 [Chloroflexi bacterium CG07_land_8_20_14_0_80_51_10]
MPYGRGWFGWGRGFGRGRGFGWGRGFGLGMGRGWGNPYRFYPWLPRRWWGYGAGYYPPAPPTPYYGPYNW